MNKVWKFFPAHLFVQGPVSFVKSVSRAPPIGSVPIYEKSQRKSHITGKIYILLIIGNYTKDLDKSKTTE
jgi:hypothetical protein